MNEFERKKEILKQFGENLKRIRKEKKISRAQISQMIGLDENSVGSYERGGREPGLSRIIQLTEILGVSLGELIEDSDEVKKKIITEYRLINAINIVDSAGYQVFTEGLGDDFRVVRLSYTIVDTDKSFKLAQTGSGLSIRGGEIINGIIPISIQYIDFISNEQFISCVERLNHKALRQGVSLQRVMSQLNTEKINEILADV